MKNFAIVLFLGFYISISSAQPLEKYQGKLQNGFTDAGDVTYTYRTDPKTKEHLKQGNFRYTVKARDDQWRFNHTVAGAYANNLKEGLWSYKVNQKDYRLQDPKRYTTGNIQIDVNYSGGLPDGRWRYEATLKSREGEKKQDKWIWGKTDSAQTVIVELQFSKGVITGPFYAKNELWFTVRGSFDAAGFFDGEWVWQFPDSTVAITWDKGLEVKTMVTDPEGNVLHLEEHLAAASVIREYQTLASAGNTGVKDFPFSLDTISLLSNTRYQLTELLHATIYHPKYTLPEQIGGDKAIYYDRQTYRMRFNIKGMYVINMKNRISGTQVQHYSRMEAIISRMEAQLAFIYQMRRDGKLKKQAADAIRLMEHNLTLARRYGCTGETLKLYLNHNDGLQKATTSCAYLTASMDQFPPFRSKDDALQFIVNKTSDLEKENQEHYTNIRKNLVN
jgi:hypothetical protein